MRAITIPLSGRLLIAHMAAYGLASVLVRDGYVAHVGHDPSSLEMEPQVTTSQSDERVAALIRRSAVESEPVVDADLNPGAPRNDQRPVIWARTPGVERAVSALRVREQLLDQAERDGAGTALRLVAGLGVAAAWTERPQRGATRLDGVMGNRTSDFVRGVLRRARPEVAAADPDDLTPGRPYAGEDEDRTGWAPPGTRVAPLHQWLATLGLGMLPVAQSTGRLSVTPCFWRDGKGLTLPILDASTTVARLRALLQRPELQAPGGELDAHEASRLRTLGVRELVRFAVIDRSTPQSRRFTFARGVRVEL